MNLRQLNCHVCDLDIQAP